MANNGKEKIVIIGGGIAGDLQQVYMHLRQASRLRFMRRMQSRAASASAGTERDII